MQTIDEYKLYSKQLEDEVGKWHHSYDAVVVERNSLVSKIRELEKDIKELNEIIEKCSAELDELRKHEVELDLSKARVKELESVNKDKFTVTSVEIFPFKTSNFGRVKGVASVTLSNSILIRGIRINKCENGLFVSYPMDRFFKGEGIRSIVLPVTKELREHIENAVLEKFQEVTEFKTKEQYGN